MPVLSLTLSHIVWAIGIAAAFVFWPTIGKYSGASGTWVNTLILIWSTIAGVAFSMPAMISGPTPSLRAVGLMALAGLINGAAVYYYSVLTADATVPTGRLVAVVTIFMVILGPLFAYFLNGEVISLRHWAGLAAAVIAVLLIAG